MTANSVMPQSRNREAWQKRITSSDLPATARLIALAISLYTDASGGQGVWLSSSDVARLVGIRALTTVNSHVRTLTTDGWLRREDGAWFLAFPGELALGTAAAR